MSKLHVPRWFSLWVKLQTQKNINIDEGIIVENALIYKVYIYKICRNRLNVTECHFLCGVLQI